MNESSMQAVLMQWAMERKHHEVVLPNNRMYWPWEADLLSVTKAWFVHEYEIKVDRRDFLADTNKKRKHNKLERAEKGSLAPAARHYETTPNYFWYATWGFDIERDEIPSYAGWMRVEWNERRKKHVVRIQENAPRLHSHKMKEKNRFSCARWLSYKLKNEYQDKYLEYS